MGYQNVDYVYGPLKLTGTGFNPDLMSSLPSANVPRLSEQPTSYARVYITRSELLEYLLSGIPGPGVQAPVVPGQHAVQLTALAERAPLGVDDGRVADGCVTAVAALVHQ